MGILRLLKLLNKARPSHWGPRNTGGVVEETVSRATPRCAGRPVNRHASKWITSCRAQKAGLTTLTTCRCCVPGAIAVRATETARTSVIRVDNQTKTVNDGLEHPW